MRRNVLLVAIFLALLAIAASAASVTVIKISNADSAGFFLNPYYENLNAPVSGCTAPCLTVDTQLTEPNPSSGTLSLDGHGIGANNPSPSTVSVTTSATNDVIVVMVMCNPGVTSMSISGGGLTWNTRFAVETVGTRSGAEYWAYASSTLSSVTVSITYSGGSACNPAYIAIHGANTANPFDTNTNLPNLVNANSPASCTISTNNANDILFGYMMQGGSSSPTGPSGWTALDTYPAAEHWDAYTIVSTIQSSLSATWTATASSNISGFCDAVVQASGSFSLTAGSSMYLWSPQFASAASIPAGALSLQLFADLPAPALDGSATGTWTTGSTFSVSAFATTKTNDVVILSIKTYSSGASVTVSSVIDSMNSILWQKTARSSFVACSGTQEVTNIEWYGIASAIVHSDTIAVTLSSAPTAASGIAFGVSGADTTTPFDPISGLPTTASTCAATSTVPTVSGVSTAEDNDFVFSLFGSYTSVTETAGSIGGTLGTLVNTVAGVGDSNAAEYRTGVASLSSASCTFGTSTTYWGILCDALMPARQTITVSYVTTNAAGAVQSTMISGSAATITAFYAPVSLSSSAGTVPASGYIRVIITAPAGAALTIYWGYPKLTQFQVSYTYKT
jgi:hypothetical protein